jgi:hypothetical protein
VKTGDGYVQLRLIRSGEYGACSAPLSPLDLRAIAGAIQAFVDTQGITNVTRQDPNLWYQGVPAGVYVVSRGHFCTSDEHVLHLRICADPTQSVQYAESLPFSSLPEARRTARLLRDSADALEAGS